MKKYELWRKDNDSRSSAKSFLLVEPDKIEIDVAWTDNIICIEKKSIADYTAATNNINETFIDYLKEHNIKYSYCREYGTKNSLNKLESEGYVLFDTSLKRIVKADDFEYQNRYSWWSGCGWQYIYADGTEKKVSVSDDNACLDEYEGKHEYAHKIINIDEELVEDKILVIKSMGYRGIPDYATIYTKSELILYLKEFNRDIEKLIKGIEAINIK